MDNFKVSLSLNETLRYIESGMQNTPRIDYHLMMSDDKHMVMLLVYEKHFYRAGNKLTLTITLDNLEGFTKVHCVSGGGGSQLLNVDWGASDSFASQPREILRRYIIS